MVAINPETGYDLGLQFNEATGEIEVMGDFYDGSLARAFGENLNSLKQQYSCKVIEDYVAQHGYSVETNKLENGEIEMLATQ